MTDWATIYYRHLARGEDHGYAAYAADNWEERRKKIRNRAVNDQLKPCPFCGGKAEITDAKEAGPRARVICCRGCLCSTKVIYALKGDVDEQLVQAWNRRYAYDL